MTFKDSEYASKVKAVIENGYGIDVTSTNRDRDTSDLRKMWCGLMHKNTRMTFRDISSVIKKSVGSVAYYIDTHKQQQQESKVYADRFANLEKEVERSVLF